MPICPRILTYRAFENPLRKVPLKMIPNAIRMSILLAIFKITSFLELPFSSFEITAIGIVTPEINMNKGNIKSSK